MDQNKELAPGIEQLPHSWPRLHKLIVKGEVRFVLDAGPSKFVHYDPSLAAELFAEMRGQQQPGAEAAA